MEMDLDLRNYDDADAAEQGDRIPAGYYLAEVADHFEDTKSEYPGSYKYQLVLDDSAGKVLAGRKLFFGYSDPSNIDDEKKKSNAMTRCRMLASRLNLIAADGYGKQARVNFDNAVGQKVVIRVVRKPDKKDPTKVWSEVDYDGVYPLDHPDIPDADRKRLNLPPARPKGAKGSPSTASGVTVANAGNGTPANNGGAPRPDRFASL